MFLDQLRDVLRGTDVRVIVLAVVVGGQVSAMLASVINVLGATVQQFTYRPVLGSSLDVARILKASLVNAAFSLVFHALVAVGTVWLLTRILGRREEPEATSRV